MDLSNLMGTIALLLICIVLPSALAMYFSAPPDSTAGYKLGAGRDASLR